MKPSLLDAIKAENYLGPSTGCTMKHIMDTMTKDDRNDLMAALADPNIQHTAIVRALKNRNFPVKPSAVPRHRKGECSCEPG